MIQIIPAIDIIEGKCVRLTRGDYSSKKVYDLDPVEMAKAYEGCGVQRIHLVDLDGAKAGKPENLRTLEAVAGHTSLQIEWGGGLSEDGALRSAFSAGATQAIVGSVAALHPDLFEQWLESFGAGKMILGADVREGKVAVKGWLEDSPATIFELMDRFGAKGLSDVICTDITKDGMLQGPSFDFYSELQGRYPLVSVTVSGGISSMADIEELERRELRKVIVGKAIYENRITLEDIRKWSLNA